MLISGPFAGGPVDEIPDGYEPVDGFGALAIWSPTRETEDELRVAYELMSSASVVLEAARVRQGGRRDVIADSEDVRTAIEQVGEASRRQEAALRRLAPDLF